MNRGFSLIQVMIAASMLGGLAVVMMKQQVSSERGQKKISHDLEITHTINEIESILSFKENCRATFSPEAGDVAPLLIDGQIGYSSQGTSIKNGEEYLLKEVRISKMKPLHKGYKLCSDLKQNQIEGSGCWMRDKGFFSLQPCSVKQEGEGKPSWLCGSERPYQFAREGSVWSGPLCARLCGSRDGWSWRSFWKTGRRVDGGLKLERIYLGSSIREISTGNYWGKLKLEFVRNQKVAIGVATITKNIPIFLELDSENRVISCYTGPCCGKDDRELLKSILVDVVNSN